MTTTTNASTQHEPLPCPWCGKVPDTSNPNSFWLDDATGGKWGAVQCCCIGPDIRTGYSPLVEWRDEAIDAWNERAPDTERQRLTARITELEAALRYAIAENMALVDELDGDDDDE